MPKVAVLVAILSLAPSAYSRSRAVAHPGPSSNIAAVMFAEIYPVEVRPGSQRQFILYEYLGAGPFNFRPVTGIHVRWTIEPNSWYAQVDPTGILTVHPETSPGMTLRLYANLNHGERIISLPVYVYRVGNNPFLDGGVWQQTAEISCDGSPDLPVSNGITELRFHVSGFYSVTWQPFELYTDFWGPYTFSTTKRKLTFGVSGGNYEPEDIKGEGAFDIIYLGPSVPTSWGTNIRPAQLRLKNIYLGSARSAGPRSSTPCGMVFAGNIEIP